jgi:hypothetical protein
VKWAPVPIVTAALAILAAGCGGGSSSDANEVEASKSFITKTGSNKLPKFGEEADEDEREAASEVVEEDFKAREKADWAIQCTSLSAGAIKRAEEEAAIWSVGPGCAKNLAELAEPLYITKEIRENTLTGPIDALRVKGDRGWALYHGTKGKDYAIRMEKEDDDWKVDALATVELH